MSGRGIRTVLVGLVVVTVAAGLLVFVGWLAWQGIADLRQEVAAPVIVGSMTVLASVIVVVFTNQRQRGQEIEQEHRRQKIPIYEGFMESMFRILLAEKVGLEPLSPQEVAQFFVSFTEKLTLWGSDEVLLEWTSFKTGFPQDRKAAPDEAIDLLLAFEHLLYALRKDVGHNNDGLAEGDLLKMWVTDIDKYLPAADSTG